MFTCLPVDFPKLSAPRRATDSICCVAMLTAMLLRDVIERHAVSHPVALRWMARQLLGNAGGTFSVNKFSNDLRSQRIPVAKDTLHAYLAISRMLSWSALLGSTQIPSAARWSIRGRHILWIRA